MQTEASVHSLFIKKKKKKPGKEKVEHRKSPRRVHKREEIMTAEVFFLLSHFSLVCWNFHPSKPYFLVPGFTLTPVPLKNSIEYPLQKEDTIPKQNVLHCCSSDLMTSYGHQTLPRVLSEQFLLPLQNATYLPALWSNVTLPPPVFCSSYRQ